MLQEKDLRALWGDEFYEQCCREAEAYFAATSTACVMVVAIKRLREASAAMVETLQRRPQSK